MIILTPGDIEWDSANAAVLKSFLETPTGRRVIDCLAFNAPAFEDGSQPNKTLVASGRVQGYQEAVSTLLRLTKENPTEPARTEDYPSLDDDTAWKDTAPPEVDKIPD